MILIYHIVMIDRSVHRYYLSLSLSLFFSPLSNRLSFVLRERKEEFQSSPLVRGE